MTNINELVDELKDLVGWQRTPEELDDSDYQNMIIRAIRKLYIDTGRASGYSRDKIVITENVIEEDEDDPLTEEILCFTEDLKSDEVAYVLIVAQIEFFKRIQTDVNNIVSYTTDALSVANADKPYAHLQDTIANLEQERRIAFYKMVSYSFYSA